MALRAYIYLIITTAGWGGNAVAGKLAVGHISPAMLTSLRWVVALMILVPLGRRQLRADWPVIRRHLPLLLFLGFLGMSVFNNMLYLALTRTSAIHAALLQAATPLVIFVASFVIFRLRTSIPQIGGFTLSFIGVAVIASHGDLSRLLGFEINTGDAILLLAVLAYGLYTVFLRWKPQLHGISLMTVLAVAALGGSLPFVFWEASTGNMILPDIQGWLVTLYAATVASIISQILYIRGNELIGGNRAGLFFNLVPIFGTLFAVIILSEQFRLYHFLALLLVLGGIALAERWPARGADATATAPEKV